MITEPDSSSNAVLATATLVGTVESSQKQQQQQQIVSITATNNSEINEDGKGLGVAMFVLQLVGLILYLGIYPPLAYICIFITIILSLILSCGCFCAKRYDLKANRRYVYVTLILMVFMIIFQSTIGTSFEQGTLVSGILLLISIISTGLFIWDRDTPRINAMPVEVISDRWQPTITHRSLT